MNRVSRLIHKARFLCRHRRILAYSHKYVITDDDLNSKPGTALQTSTDNFSEIENAKMIEELVDDFDFKGNDMDRRFFFEVTGRQLVEGEFDDLDSSDEDWALL